MAFGPIMRLSVGELNIELAPIDRKEDALTLMAGLQRASVSRYLGMETAPVIEDEYEWYERTRTNDRIVVWGIWVSDGDQRTLIGNTALTDIKRGHVHQATSGSLIADTVYWGRGIASAIHKARTWYAFERMGLHRIQSAVLHGNTGSRKALSRSGYELVYVERNEKFVDGRLVHLDCLECLNPNEPFWSQWWHGERPLKRQIEARNATQEALIWAREHVELL